MPPHLSGNLDRFTGLAAGYDASRPRPPRVLVELLCRVARTARPSLVVDLGSGTGLSTLLWAEHAEAVLGIEPNAEMRAEAERRAAPNVRFRQGLSSDTGVPDGSADVVTCAQSLHWMEPEGTFQEVSRILRPGGVFAAYDYDLPPAIDWEVEAAFSALMRRVAALEEKHGVRSEISRWAKSEHAGRMRASGRFRFVRELLVHNVEQGDARRLLGLALSQGSVGMLLRRGVSEEEIGIREFRETASRVLGEAAAPWHVSYRVRLGVK